jgi:hypothetical protein
VRDDEGKGEGILETTKRRRRLVVGARAAGFFAGLDEDVGLHELESGRGGDRQPASRNEISIEPT